MIRLAFALVLLLSATGLRAEDLAAVQDEVVEPEAGQITGTFELRPTVAAKTGYFHSENTVALGYKFDPSFELGAVQYFDNNISEPGDNAFTIQDAFLRAKFNNVWVAPESGWSFSYQPRFYLPTQQRKRDAGLITYIRNYLNFTKQMTPSFALTLTELPIFHIYSKAGTVDASGASANPVFENRIYVVADWNMGEGFSLSLPLFFHQTRHADFVPAAANNNTWSFFLYTWPEVSYSLNANTTLGLSYFTGNFTNDTLGDLNIARAFENGAGQFVFRMSL